MRAVFEGTQSRSDPEGVELPALALLVNGSRTITFGGGSRGGPAQYVRFCACDGQRTSSGSSGKLLLESYSPRLATRDMVRTHAPKVPQDDRRATVHRMWRSRMTVQQPDSNPLAPLASWMPLAAVADYYYLRR